MIHDPISSGQHVEMIANRFDWQASVVRYRSYRREGFLVGDLEQSADRLHGRANVSHDFQRQFQPFAP